MIAQFNRDGKAPFTMRMAIPADYEAAVPARPDWPVFKGNSTRSSRERTAAGSSSRPGYGMRNRSSSRRRS